MSENDNSWQITHLHREYTKGKLRRQNIPSEPLTLFKLWLKQAYEARLNDPNAMSISTVDKYGQPYQRIVLLKHYDANGLVFYTSLISRKAYHIKKNPLVSILFPWHMLERQIIVNGKAERLSVMEEIKYFHSRPRNSQISTWVSKQSSRISARKVLEDSFLKLKLKFKRKEIPMPNFWGGFRVSIKQMEFWQGGKYRLHDRFLYRRKNNRWIIDRLSP